VPPYLKPHDFISDYFVDVFAIDGNFGPDKYSQLDTDPVYGEFFNSKGLIKDKLTDFLSRAEVNLRQVYTGCLIPNFKDQQGVPYYIEDVINNQYTRFGILCAVDKSQINAIEFGTNTKNLDLVGHSLIDTALSEVDFLSYKKRIKEDKVYTQSATNTDQTLDDDAGRTINYATGKVTITFTDAHTDFAWLEANAAVGDLIAGTRTSAGNTAGVPVASPVLEVTSVTKTSSLITIVATNDFKASETSTSGSFVDVALTGVGTDEVTYTPSPDRFTADGTDTYYVVDKFHPIYTDYQAGLLANGDTITDSTDTYYIKFVESIAAGGVDAADDYRDILKLELYTDADLSTAAGAGTAPAVTTTFDSNSYAITAADSINIVSVIGDLNTDIAVTEKVTDNVVRIAIADAGKVSFDDFLVGLDDDGNEILTRIDTMVNIDTDNDDINDTIEITCTEKIKIAKNISGSDVITRYKDFENFITEYNMIYQAGFAYKAHHMPNGTNDRVKDIYSVMTGTNMRDALVDPDMINFRYIVDTFNNGLETGSKSYLAKLARDRQRCLALLNAPSFKEFADSTNPRFTTTPTAADPLPILDVQYIKDGGNRSENPSFLYTMPLETDGASFVGFFAPNVIIRDGDNDVVFPPAALVSNAFMRKYRAGQPFKPVANRRGVLSYNGTSGNLIGVEYKLNKEDRGLLETKGINPIIQRQNGNITVYGNQTSYQTVRSALNNLHVRDLLISLTIDIENILENYVFEFNDDPLRIEVSSLLNNYLSKIQTAYSVIRDNYQVVFDRSNNTDSIIRENTAIVDVIIEPTAVARRFINRITLTASGDPLIGGFTAL